ncbi:4-hydroxybenzoate 3-monooxygenase [Salinarimonas sp.]|uniref:4-hydroxybenzoate 3-monooxygenase n=1 Tax=Salinarimonas sp. TaxID=2766526 RepID=UPI0032D9330E
MAHRHVPAKKVQVGIIGAGPAGLLLAHLLHLAGISSVVIEAKSRKYVEERIRAGVLEQGTVDVLRETGIGARMDREGLLHHGTILKFAGEARRIDFQDLTGQAVMVYGQHEVVKDLIAARLESGGEIVFDVSDTRIDGIEGREPTVSYLKDGARHTLACDFVAGCDGFHGVSRAAIPADVLRVYERVYPFGWLGILAKSPPASEELIYANHERGFALLSMRSPEISRLYLQCPPDEEIANWPDERIWEELQVRLAGGEGWRLEEGPVIQKGVTAMRSFVAEPMRHGRLFLAGDAAHIVPPTGAKGMNLAVGDVRVLARGLEAFYRDGGEDGLAAYSDTCLRRIWKVQRFSWWMTQMLHTFDDASPFDRRRQLAELDYLTTSRAAATTLAENYVGLPMDWGPQ